MGETETFGYDASVVFITKRIFMFYRKALKCPSAGLTEDIMMLKAIVFRRQRSPQTFQIPPIRHACSKRKRAAFHFKVHFVAFHSW